MGQTGKAQNNAGQGTQIGGSDHHQAFGSSGATS